MSEDRLDYFFRDRDDGQCEVICTSCFQGIGLAQESGAIQQLMENHACNPHKISTDPETSPSGRTMRTARKRLQRDTGGSIRPAAALVLVAFSLYIIPNLFEWMVSQFVTPWFAVLVLGDLAGCIALIFVFRRVWLGILLFIATFTAKAVAFEYQSVSPDSLIWITDLLPTLFAAMLLRHVPGRSNLPHSFC